ncbi:MAG: PHA/PHB synthase family protein [Bradymonadaceae bacterium]
MPLRALNIFNKLRRGKPAVGMTPHDVVHHENKWRLLRYRPTGDPRSEGSPILLVPSLINRHYVLDLMPGKSFVEYLVGEGHDVYIIDWGTPGPEDRHLSFEDICIGYLGRAVRRVARESPTGKTHLLGYCLGGTMTTVYAAAFGDEIASMVNLAAPVDFEDDGLLGIWSRIPHFDLQATIEACGNMPWHLMQLGFNLLRPTLVLSKAVYALDRAGDEVFLDGFFAIETWGNDNVSFPGRAFLEYIEYFYRDNTLIKDSLVLAGHPIRLQNITSPLLCVSFEHDNIVSVRSAAAIVDRVSSTHKEHLCLCGGHVGAVVSSKARHALWPRLSAWFASCDGESIDFSAAS